MVQDRKWCTPLGWFYVVLVCIAGLVAASGTFSYLVMTQLLRALLWGFLGGAILFEWHEKPRWYLLILGVGAGLCFTAQLIASADTARAIAYSINASNVKDFGSLVRVGVPLGVVGYVCVFGGTVWWIGAHLRRLETTRQLQDR
jgi:hypothetical protein